MPTYAYLCKHCGHRFEAFQSITANPLKKCPECSKASLRRLIGTGAGFIFKGSGFYCTDYRSDGYKKAAEKDTGATKDKTGDKKETKSETTPSPAVKSESAAAKKTA
jgi:putative FmdB family regulatory protein